MGKRKSTETSSPLEVQWSNESPGWGLTGETPEKSHLSSRDLLFYLPEDCDVAQIRFGLSCVAGCNGDKDYSAGGLENG